MAFQSEVVAIAGRAGLVGTAGQVGSAGHYIPNTRPALVDFAYLICKNNSLMICGNIVKERLTHEMRSNLQQKAYRYLRFTKIKGYFSISDNSDLQTGVAAMLSLSGVGKVKPNILMMGYKNDWATCDRNLLDQYVLTIHSGFEMNVAVAILRLKEGLDCSEVLADVDDAILKASNKKTKGKKETLEIPALGNETPDRFTASTDTETQTEISTKDQSFEPDKKKKKAERNHPFRDTTGKPLPKSVLNNIILFQSKQKKNTIDVWWLSDDGGLTLLLPVIINNRSNWSATKLRVFCTASGVNELEKDHRGMTILLSKFRIDYSDLVIINDADEAPKEKTKKWFNGIAQPLLKPGTNGPLLTKEELEVFQYKTDRYLRLRELLLDHCSDSNLVVMTLPITRKGDFSAPLYMAWLEALTANMPPFMLVRGNQTSVLIFYS
ncbi:hypothetical protein DAPPUDRAFT_333094 [Daphnia pulex]|uniref:SLC12A transporter C-terminal domain-containing protein n=1 Tax=Daphnia pulex TaxID=6669 RepID=E9HRU5_DAPPU|nr:hypothetical protein DAPPUDRAFT_333094 [Daphnia pulex]|eukprot:EFX65509.1 hypothetical protein DAPPUDRAFT_333094 [Daphnia pulex]